MAAELFRSGATGAGLEVVFSGFIELVGVVIKENIMFKPTLKMLEQTLRGLEPSLRKIDGFNREFDRPDETQGLRELITKGQNLVTKCSKISRHNFVMKPIYNRKLLKLNNSIQRFINVNMRVNQTLDQKETLFEVKNLSVQMQQLKMAVTSGFSVGVGGGAAAGAFGFGFGACSPPGLREQPVGLEVPIKELKGKLLKDEDSSSLIVISGLGGSGKTTLALSLCHDDKIKGKFENNIFYVTVSKTPNLQVIIQRLFQHTVPVVPSFQSNEDAVHQLEQLFKQTAADCPILLVLDDVWPGSESVLELLKFRKKNYKILVTSRYEFPGIGYMHRLQTLGDADAMKLFCQTALMPDGDFYKPHKHLLEQIVKSCGGFPLAISVVGKSLRGRGAADWQNKAESCSKKTATILSDAELLERLQSSVDALSSTVKECFMDLGSFPEDHRISATSLLDIWMERHNLEEYSAMANLQELANRSLFHLIPIRKIASEVDGSYDEHVVEQHDLMRELSMLQSKSCSMEKRERVFVEITEGKFPDWWTETNQQMISAKLLSISTDNKFSPNWGSLVAPDVEALLLNFQSENYSLPQFMERMDKLKVLIITNFSFFPAELGNFPVLSSLSTLKRIRLEKISLPSYFLGSIQLLRLEKLSLKMCDVAAAFNNGDFQTMGTLPNLKEICIDYCNDLVKLPAGICQLARLRKLIITNCHKLMVLPEELGKLTSLEVLKLNACIELVGLPNTIGGLQKLRVLDMSDCLSITELPEQIGALRNLSTLCMIDCYSCELPTTVRNLVSLKVLISDEETADKWENFKIYLRDLEIKVRKDINLNWLG